MNVHRLLVTISADGTVSARTQGVTGPGCLGHIALLEDLLDARTTASEHTEEHLRARACATAPLDRLGLLRVRTAQVAP